MDSLVVFRKNASHRPDSPQPSRRTHGLMMSDPKVVETGALITPVVTQPRSPRKGRTHQTVQAEPAPINLVSFVELYRELCCSNECNDNEQLPNERDTFNCFRSNAAVVDSTPQRYPRAELMLEFEYDTPPVPEISADMRSGYGRDYHHSFM